MTSVLPAGHSFTTPLVAEHAAIDLVGVGGQGDALNSDRHVSYGIAHQRQQAGMSHARAEGAARMKAQHFVDVGGQRCQIDATNVGEVASGERASDWAGLFP